MLTCRTCGHWDAVHFHWVGRCLHNNGISAKDPNDTERCLCIGLHEFYPKEVTDELA